MLDDVKEQQGSRFFIKIEQEFQNKMKFWVKPYEKLISFLEYIDITNNDKVNLDTKEKVYHELEEFLKEKLKTELQEAPK